MMDEQQLIADFRKGKRDAQKMVFELHAPAMMAVCIRYVRDRETARDLLQDGFIRVFENAESYSGKGPLGAWIRRVIVNTVLEHLRRNDALKMSINIEDHFDYTDSYQPDILNKISTDEILKCVDELPTGFRTVFNLFAIEDYSHAEIASMLNINESTSRSQYMRARNLLQKKLLTLNITTNELKR